MNIYFMSKSFEHEADQETQFYHTKYKVEDISEQLKGRMLHPKCDESVK